MVSQLVESLPYIRKFKDSIVVVKLGGSALIHEECKEKLLEDVAFMHSVGIKVVVAHGGGKNVDGLLSRLGKKSTFVEGYRASPPEDISDIEMVLSAQVNKSIVSELNVLGISAVGLSGKDAAMVEIEKLRGAGGEDLGNVGRITKVQTRLLNHLLEGGYVPVVSSISSFYNGDTANINADELAAKVASSLKALKLIFVTDVDGLRIKDEMVDEVDLREAESFLNSDSVSGGMKPKLEFTIQAIKEGVSDVHMINGTVDHSMLVELFTKKGIGSKFTYSRRRSD